jgi:hypothetical protein
MEAIGPAMAACICAGRSELPHTPAIARVALDEWPALLRAVIGPVANGAWLVEIFDQNGAPVCALGNSPATGGTVGWLRPDLEAKEAAALRAQDG